MTSLALGRRKADLVLETACRGGHSANTRKRPPSVRFTITSAIQVSV